MTENARSLCFIHPVFGISCTHLVMDRDNELNFECDSTRGTGAPRLV